MSQLTESEIIDAAYSILEQDNETWDSADSEYLTARRILNVGVRRWERYDDTTWRELISTLDEATTDIDSAALVKTLTAGDYDYKCPGNMRRPSSYVRTVSGANSTYWRVIPPEDIAGYANSSDNVCWFTGSLSVGFTLNFNPKTTLNTGDTIKYEYYKQATLSTATTSKPEMDDPNFLIYFIAAHLSAEGGIDDVNFGIAEQLLENMRTQNISGFHLISDPIQNSPDEIDGFGT